jgi:hypothetical protein
MGTILAFVWSNEPVAFDIGAEILGCHIYKKRVFQTSCSHLVPMPCVTPPVAIRHDNFFIETVSGEICK